MTELLHFDEYLFQLINHGLQNPVFDVLFPLLRNKFIWLPFYVFITGFLLVNFRKQGLLLIMVVALTVGVSDLTSSQLLKKSIKRIRPCHIYQSPESLHLLVPCGSGYSFPSSHATNHFALATILSFFLRPFFRKIYWPLGIWALTVSFAQVYVGVHYPVDVLCGALLGIMIGVLFGFIGRIFIKKQHFDYL